MNPAAFTAWLNAITAADTALARLIVLGHSVRADLSADDQTTLDSRLAALESQNDAVFTRVDGELKVAQGH